MTRTIADRLLELKPPDKQKSRLQHMSDSLSVLLSMILKLMTILTILVLIIGVVLQQFWSRSDVVLDEFKVPPELEQKGYKPNVIATRLADRMKFISSKTVESVSSNIGASASTSVAGSKGALTAKSFIGVPTFKLTAAESSLDIEVPQTRATVGSLFRYIFEAFGVKPTHIGGDIVRQDSKLVLTIRITDRDTTRVLGMIEEDSGNPEGLLAKGAEAIYKDIKPVVLAWYFYGSKPAQTDGTKSLIQDCIYQNKDAALANVLWAVMLLNEGNFDGALTKIKDAERLKPETTIREILVSCEARALEGKGDYDGAKATYERALMAQYSVLTLTNYAAFLVNRGFVRDASHLYKLSLYEDNTSDIAHIGMGWVHEAQGNYDEAIREYRKAIELSPRSVTPYINLANGFVNKKDYQMAMQAAQKAVEVGPDSADAHNTLGYVLYSSNLSDQAMKEYELAVTIHPRFVTAYVNWADVLLNLRKYDEAIAKAQKALEIDSTSVYARTELALIMLNTNDYDGAIKQCEQAVQRDPRFVAAYANWISALLGQNRFEEAEAKAREITGIAPESADAHNNLGYVLTTRGKHDEAIIEFKEATRLNRFNPYVYINWAQALMDRKEYAEAATRAQDAINLDSSSVDAHNVLGYILRKSRDFDGALKQHEIAIQLNPFNVYSYTGWVDALLAKKTSKDDESLTKDELLRAVDYATKAVEHDPRSADAYNTLGLVLVEVKEYKKAIACYLKAIELNRYNVYSYTNLSDVYLNESYGYRDTNKALDLARKAVEVDSGSVDAHASLGWAQMAKENYGEAVTAFEKAVSLKPLDASLRFELADALRAAEKYDEAEREVRAGWSLDPTYASLREAKRKAKGE
jgi:tetratricopeptide (TPR) repeat protein